MKIEVDIPRTIKVGDYIYGHFVSPKTGKNIDFDFVLIDKNKGIANSIKDTKPRTLEEAFDREITIDCPIIYTDSPLGKVILNRFPETTFIIDDIKFYVDKIMRYNEVIKKEKNTK